MKIYIIRHGEVPHNLLRKYDSADEDLTTLGVKQAKKARKEICKIDYDIIVSSPLLRAKHTAEIINFKNKKIIIDERLKERNVGNLAGISLEKTNRDEYWNYYTKVQYGTSERIQPFFERVYDYLDDLSKKDYNTVLIVAHSGVSKAFNGYFEGIKNGMFLERGLKNCEIEEYEL